MTISEEEPQRLGSEGDLIPYLRITMANDRAIEVYCNSHRLPMIFRYLEVCEVNHLCRTLLRLMLLLLLWCIGSS